MTSELKVEKTHQGSGETAQKGQVVSVHYVGQLEDGTRFDSSRERGQPIEFVLGQGQVIRGWDEGIAGLRVGDQARLTIPAELGYGERGVPGVIPAGATLIFDIELMGVR